MIKIHTVKSIKISSDLIYLQLLSDTETTPIQYRTCAGLFQVRFKHINHILSQNLIKYPS